ncbi:MAG: hypothetical protein ACHQAZ_07690, partial [Gammaproteobacteria bacterium]
ATLVPAESAPATELVERIIEDLVVVAEFRDPIYPGLVSTGKVEHLPDSRLRLIEEFQWLTRPESGTNVFEELKP